MNSPRDTRSAQAKAYHWVSRVISIALEMVIPGLLGYWLDSRVGTQGLFTVCGFVLGMVLGMWHLLKIAKTESDHGSAASGTGADER